MSDVWLFFSFLFFSLTRSSGDHPHQQMKKNTFTFVSFFFGFLVFLLDFPPTLGVLTLLLYFIPSLGTRYETSDYPSAILRTGAIFSILTLANCQV